MKTTFTKLLALITLTILLAGSTVSTASAQGPLISGILNLLDEGYHQHQGHYGHNPHNIRNWNNCQQWSGHQNQGATHFHPVVQQVPQQVPQQVAQPQPSLPRQQPRPTMNTAAVDGTRVPVSMQGTWFEVSQNRRGEQILNKYVFNADATYDLSQYAVSAEGDVDLGQPIAQLSRLASAQQRTISINAQGVGTLGAGQSFAEGPLQFAHATDSSGQTILVMGDRRARSPAVFSLLLKRLPSPHAAQRQLHSRFTHASGERGHMSTAPTRCALFRIAHRLPGVCRRG